MPNKQCVLTTSMRLQCLSKSKVIYLCSCTKKPFNQIAYDISILDGESFGKKKIRERFQLIEEISE